MTEFRIGDIVKIERGEEGKPGYELRVCRVTREFINDSAYVTIATVEAFYQPYRVTVIKRAPKFGTALVKYDCKLMPALVKSDGKMILSNGETVPRIRIDEDSLIETCPYVPLDLIERAEAWASGALEWTAEMILGSIVNAVRKYRDGTP